MLEDKDEYFKSINREREAIAREFTGYQNVQLLGRSTASAYRFAHDWVVRISPTLWDSDKLYRAKKLLNRDIWGTLVHLPRIYRLEVTRKYIITVMKYYVPIADWYDDNNCVDLDEIFGWENLYERLNVEAKRVFGDYVHDAHKYNIGLDRNLVPVVFDFWI